MLFSTEAMLGDEVLTFSAVGYSHVLGPTPSDSVKHSQKNLGEREAGWET